MKLTSHLPEITRTFLRIVAALMLMQHGAQKHFGLLLAAGRTFDGAPEMLSRTWFAGTLELCGGALLALGLFTRPVAFVLAGEMAFAYFLVHAKIAFWPVMNRGELAALNCFVFLFFAASAGGPYSADALIARARHPRSR